MSDVRACIAQASMPSTRTPSTTSSVFIRCKYNVFIGVADLTNWYGTNVPVLGVINVIVDLIIGIWFRPIEVGYFPVWKQEYINELLTKLTGFLGQDVSQAADMLL